MGKAIRNLNWNSVWKYLGTIRFRTTPDGRGVAAINVDLDQIEEIAQSITIGNAGYAYILDADRNYIYHPVKEVGSQAADNEEINHLYSEDHGTFEYKFEDGSYKEMAFATNQLTGWKLAGTFYTSEFSDTASPILQTLIIVLIVFIILGSVLSYIVLRSIIRPLNRLIDVTRKVGAGDLTDDFSL